MRRVTLSVIAGLIVSLACLNAAPGAGEAYESPTALKASEVLPAQLRAGEDFKVEEEVENDGFMNHYRVSSDYGPFSAYGNLELIRLLHQIHAIRVLDELSDTEEFAKALGRSAKGQLDTVKDFADRPVDTVQGIPHGIKRMFKKYKKQAAAGYDTAKAVGSDVGDAIVPGKDDSDDAAEAGAEEEPSGTEQVAGAATSYAKKWFGVSGSERHWYKTLEIDPYHRNEVLRKMVKHISKVDAAAHVGMKLVPSIPGVDYLNRVNHAVWDADPAELRAENVRRLQDAGIDPVLIKEFMDNEYLSPTQQTFLLSTLAHLEDVRGREVLLRLAADSESPEVAGFNLANTLFLTVYHRDETPIVEVLPGEPVPVAMTADGGLLIIVSADYAFWDEDLGGVIQAMANKFADREVTFRRLWLRGEASPRFVAEIEALGWSVSQTIDLTKKVEELFVAPMQDLSTTKEPESTDAGDGAPVGESDR